MIEKIRVWKTNQWSSKGHRVWHVSCLVGAAWKTASPIMLGEGERPTGQHLVEAVARLRHGLTDSQILDVPVVMTTIPPHQDERP